MHGAKPVARQLAFLALAAATIYGVCGRFLDNPIVFDDFFFFTTGVPEAFFAAGPRFATRWWVYETFAATVVFFGQELHWLRLGNLAAHLATAVALYFLIKRLASDLDTKGVGKLGIEVTSFAATGLFLLHPLAIFAQGYLTQRTTLMATLFSLLTLLAFWRGLQGMRGGLWLSCLLCFVAIYAKEHAVMLPAACAVLWVLHRQSGLPPGVAVRKLLLALLLQGAVSLLAVLQVKGLIGGAYEMMIPELLSAEAPIATEILYPLSLLNQAGLFFKYLGLWVLPDPSRISIDMREPFPLDFSSPGLWAGGLAYAAYGIASAALLFRGRTAGLVGAALLMPWVLFLTEFSAVRLQEPFVLYRSYLWMPPLFIAMALAARRLSRSLFVVLGLVAAAAFAALSVDRMTTLSHLYLVWNEAAELVERRAGEPGVFGAYRIYYNRGKAAYQEGMQDAALADFERAIQIKPDYGYAYHLRGTIWMSRKQWERALADFERAIALQPGYVKPYRGRAKVLETLGRTEEARETLEFACVLDSAYDGCKK
jgi:hypothetical protein